MALGGGMAQRKTVVPVAVLLTAPSPPVLVLPVRVMQEVQAEVAALVQVPAAVVAVQVQQGRGCPVIIWEATAAPGPLRQLLVPA